MCNLDINCNPTDCELACGKPGTWIGRMSTPPAPKWPKWLSGIIPHCLVQKKIQKKKNKRTVPILFLKHSLVETCVQHSTNLLAIMEKKRKVCHKAFNRFLHELSWCQTDIKPKQSPQRFWNENLSSAFPLIQETRSRPWLLSHTLSGQPPSPPHHNTASACSTQASLPLWAARLRQLPFIESDPEGGAGI